MKQLLFFGLFFLSSNLLWSGNPDRQGAAGAYELLMNPWARSAGLHSLTTAHIRGVEAMRLNVAGLSRINRTEVLLGHARYLEGTDIRMNALGLSQKIGENGAFGISIMALDFGDIPVTTTALPEGTGATYSPNFFHLGLGYAHTFDNKISVGILFRGISESTADVSALGFAIDAGIQYVTGEKDNFKFGISLRNVGSKMSFNGEGLTYQAPNPDDGENLTIEIRSAPFEIPSVLNIGMSYDFWLQEDKQRLTLVGNFTSNSFSRDQLGAGLEYALNEQFMIRGAYKIDLDSKVVADPKSIYSGLSAGMSVELPLNKDKDNKFGIDYAYRATQPFDGTHNLSLRISI